MPTCWNARIVPEIEQPKKGFGGATPKNPTAVKAGFGTLRPRSRTKTLEKSVNPNLEIFRRTYRRGCRKTPLFAKSPVLGPVLGPLKIVVVFPS